jgi:hypothetical protein
LSQDTETHNEAAEYLGDMVIAARFPTPTEANLLKNVLIAASIPAEVADAHFAQANPWMGQAVGGVRVLVPASLLESAQQTISDFENGAFKLETEEEDLIVNTSQATNLRLWGPDMAAFWSLFLTPVFGCTICYLNSLEIKDKKLMRPALIWLIVSVTLTVGLFLITVLDTKQWFSLFSLSLGISLYTLVWYIFGGYAQSKYIVKHFGSGYKKRALIPPVLGVMLISMVLDGIAFMLK